MTTQPDLSPHQDLIMQAQLAGMFRSLASQPVHTLEDCLRVFDALHQHVVATLWVEYTSAPDEKHIHHLLVDADVLTRQHFAPWLMSILQATLNAINQGKSDVYSICLVCGALNVLNTLASLLYDPEDDDQLQLDELVVEEEVFRDWWEAALLMLDQPSPFAPEPDAADVQDRETNTVGQAAFYAMSPLAKLECVAAVLQDADIEVADPDLATYVALDKSQVFGLGCVMALLVPDRCGVCLIKPFEDGIEIDSREYYADLWRHASIVAGWQIDDMSVVVDDELAGASINIQFMAFGHLHQWHYHCDGADMDGRWFADVHGFAKTYLSGRFLFDQLANGQIGYAYLPITVAQRLARLVS
ncbi:hypothetical protein [Chitinivorax sp. B]|uniref:hypothetical protein n=1 Tax=Chitinivorax sp. B TaxID=2502235 RepID=UPI0010F952C2|nr:hypothetical protein [Chitinivorax sp. B]